MTAPIARNLQSAMHAMAEQAGKTVELAHRGANDAASQQAVRAKHIYDMRRRRETALPEVADLFHEPAWDLLLDLYVAREEGQSVAVSSVCIDATVAPTTGLRVLNALEERGAVEIRSDPFNKKRKLVRLSDATHQRMSEFLITA